jgi:hypothetical protein
MALLLPLGYAQVIHSLRLTGDAEPMIVTYGVDLEESSPDPSAVADRLGSVFGNTMMGALSNQLNHFLTTVRLGTVANVPGATGVAAKNDFGSETGNLVPQNSAFLVKKVTSGSGRRNQGRMYFPGVPEAAVTNIGVLPDSGVRTNLRSAIGNWLAAIKAGVDAVDMVVLHSEGLSAAPPPTVVTSLILDDLIATQRRRLRK